MNDKLTVINHLLYEHRVISQFLETLRNARMEQEISFMKITRERDLPKLRQIVEKQYNLLQSLISLTDGLGDHCRREETELPFPPGTLVTKALGIEHRRLHSELARIRVLLTGREFNTLSWDEVMANGYELGYAIERICDMIEAHSNKEDALYGLLKTALENETTESATQEASPARTS
ncbi:MAG: hypothetical protein HY667_07155 [Chloroflexi bacterium]|nr:hypothetical protein [Chloroflexota bacterium]